MAGGVWEVSVLSAQFYCEYKTALKKSLFKGGESNKYNSVSSLKHLLC